MRILSVVIVAFALAILIVSWLERADTGGPPATLPSLDIHVTGTGNTLESVARQVNDSVRFRYDPATRTAIAAATLVVEGELQLGRKGDADSGEILELATEYCGDLRIEVRPGGVLSLHGSEIRTLSQVLSHGACSAGYALFVDGTLTLDDSRISYISGSTSQCLRGGARAEIRRSVFSYCDGSALSCINVDGDRITIEDSEILGSGNWGLVVRGCGGAPLEVRDCVLDGQVGAVFITGESARVRLIDCVFDPDKLRFNRQSGQITVAWTRTFRIADAASGDPRPNLLVRAEPVTGNAAGEAVEARTDDEGIARLVLTDWIAGARAARRAEGTNTVTPHRISVIGEAGAPVATIDALTVRGKQAEPMLIEVPGSL